VAFDVARIKRAGQQIRKGVLSARDAIRTLLFPKQQEGFDSVLTHRQTACRAGRRSGKTFLILAVIILAGFCGWNVLIVYPNAKQARNKLLAKLVRLARLLGLRVNTRTQDGVVQLGAGTLEIGSAHTRAAIDSIRGDGVHIAVIDEPGAIDDQLLVYLMDEVIGPALMDHGGRWLMTGTPSPVPVGRWEDIISNLIPTDNPDAIWNLVGTPDKPWTYEDNPELRDPERTIDAELARMGKTRASDVYLREYRGQSVSMDSVRPLHWTIANDYDELPKEPPALKITGVDIGWTDEDAIGTIYVWRGAVYLVEEEIQNRQTDPQLAAKLIGPLEERVPGGGITGGTIARHRPAVTTGDSAQAKSIANLQAEGVPITGAKKGRGSVALGLKQIDDLLKERRFFAKRTSRFVRDAAVIQWKVVGKTLKDTPHSNIIPAVRYALDEVPPQYFLPPPPPAEVTIFDSPVLKRLLTDPNADRPNYG
jgi:hypothetical protein